MKEVAINGVVQQCFAQISNGVVKNVMVCNNYELANQLTRAVYGPEAIAVACDQFPCEAGDLYHDNKFWYLDADGQEQEIPYIPTQEQQVQQLKAENQDLTLAMADLIGGAFNAN